MFWLYLFLFLKNIYLLIKEDKGGGFSSFSLFTALKNLQGSTPADKEKCMRNEWRACVWDGRLELPLCEPRKQNQSVKNRLFPRREKKKACEAHKGNEEVSGKTRKQDGQCSKVKSSFFLGVLWLWEGKTKPPKGKQVTAGQPYPQDKSTALRILMGFVETVIPLANDSLGLEPSWERKYC